MADSDEIMVFVKFKTKLKDYTVTDDPISVPKKLRRLGLSQVINHLLGTSEKPIPFDFLIQDKFLRTSLKKFIEEENINDENAIEIEYLLALGEPETSDTLQHDDWVSAIDKRSNGADQFVITGSYDSIVRFWKKEENKTLNESDKPVLTLTGHTGPIKAISSTRQYKNKQDEFVLVTASQDHNLKVWEIAGKKAKCRWTLVGHTGTVDDCDVHVDGQIVISGSWDHTIKVWKINEESEEDNAPEFEVKGNKRRKIESKENFKKPVSTLSGHHLPVSSVLFSHQSEVLSGGWDHAVRVWDLDSGINTDTLNGTKVINDITYSHKLNLIATAHNDQPIRIWDKRAHANQVNCKQLNSHKEWVSSVAFHPTRGEILVSGGYDNTIKLWDLRCVSSFYSVNDIHYN
eukprot:TRINITY_DN3828_c0_g1_i1.p1 TRINITY_DN3828_c0_g1~~TRINITY_DN3828_c0_g1_i1.p1  ORF type:complete len:403 (-),score=95.75 TRINITY_DN3828_c0_g1_i1:85-1293(-)